MLDINTAAQVVIAVGTVLGLWLAFRGELMKQRKEREARLIQLEANVENSLHDQETLNRQRHAENIGNIADMRSGFIGLKDSMLEKIHQIELALAHAGINGRYSSKRLPPEDNGLGERKPKRE